MPEPDPEDLARKETAELAAWWGVDDGWARFMIDTAMRRVGVDRGLEYMRLRITRVNTYDAALADFHREVFPDRDVPYAWAYAAHERDDQAMRAALTRQEEARAADRDRKRRVRAQGGENS
jgi:hypothetical protein